VLALPSRLYVIGDADVCQRAGWTLADFAAACFEGGARIFQVRAKQASGGELLDLAAAIVERSRPVGALIVVNDRADVARMAGAAGVHVGQDDLRPALVRRVVGAQAVIGLSTHTAEQIDEAIAEPVDYLAVGPVFGTRTKATGYDSVGLERVALAAGRAGARGLPLVAIGGITLARARAVVDAGADAVAVITDLLSTGDPTTRVREFLAALV
jgi:thiamine-phosphate pyrophosphorylase